MNEQQTGQQKYHSRVPKYSDKFKDLLNKNQHLTLIKQKHKIQPPLSSYTIISQQQNNIKKSQPQQQQSNSIEKHQNKQVNLVENDYKFVFDQKKQNEEQFFFYRVKSIGVGAHSFVYLIQQETTKFLYAQKAIIKTHAEKHLEELKNQIKIQYSLNHDNLISLYNFYCDSSYIYLIMQYAEESLFNLKQKFGIFKQKQVIEILRQLLHGIQYMHRKGYIHADIKIQNVMIRNGRVKLCDFGYATKFAEQRKIDANQIIGTLEYLSPEYVEGWDTGPLRDTWALGILCYELWTGKNPFENLKQNQKWLKLAKLDFSQFSVQLSRIQQQQSRQSQKISKFIQHTLCPSEQRYTADHLLKLQFFNIAN